MIGDQPLEPTSSDLADARRYLADDTDADVEAFARRQLSARQRLTLLVAFYKTSPCRMGRLHLLTTAAVTLGRFCGLSRTFNAIGAALMPVDNQGLPRTEAWQAYRDASKHGRPLTVRDELWMVAHCEDMDQVRERDIDTAFYGEAADNAHEPTWPLLSNHMAMTLGSRLLDRYAVRGLIPFETAMAQGMRTSLGRILHSGGRLLWRYTRETARAVLWPAQRAHRHLISYRKAAWVLLRTSITAWTASKVFRRGIRTRDRGRRSEGDAWPLLQSVLGEGVEQIHPAIVQFYSNPARHDVTASLELNTIPARFWSWIATMLVGQGLYESSDGEFDARFRVFVRGDGSMHFVRELYLGDTMRVFDSDFVTRKVDGRDTLFEVFVDHHIEVEMEVTAMEGAGLKIRGKNIYMRGFRLPQTGLRVEFRTHVPGDGKVLHIDGHLLMQPQSRLGKFFMYKVLRRPEHLGAIHYLLLFLGHLGFLDVMYFHIYTCKLAQRPECQREVLWHTLRHFIYASQFLIIANVRFHGTALLVLVALYTADVFIAWSDVWEETASRKEQGGLPRGEYFMHITLSVLVGVYIAFVGQAVWPDRLLPTAVVIEPPDVPFLLRLYMSSMGVGALGFFAHDTFQWFRFRRRLAAGDAT